MPGKTWAAGVWRYAWFAPLPHDPGLVNPMSARCGCGEGHGRYRVGERASRASSPRRSEWTRSESLPLARQRFCNALGAARRTKVFGIRHSRLSPVGAAPLLWALTDSGRYQAPWPSPRGHKVYPVSDNYIGNSTCSSMLAQRVPDDQFAVSGVGYRRSGHDDPLETLSPLLAA